MSTFGRDPVRCTASINAVCAGYAERLTVWALTTGGGTAIVYAAVDTQLGRQVALKVPGAAPAATCVSVGPGGVVRVAAHTLVQVMQPQSSSAAGDIDLNVVAVQREVSTAEAPCAADVCIGHAGGTAFILPFDAGDFSGISACAGPLC